MKDMINRFVRVPNDFIRYSGFRMDKNATILACGMMFYSYEAYDGDCIASYSQLKEVTGLNINQIKKAIETEFNRSNSVDGMFGDDFMIYYWEPQINGKLTGRYRINFSPSLYENNFTMLPIAVLASKKINPSDKKIYLYLLRLYGDDSIDVFPSHENISKKTGIPKDTVKKSIKRLNERGFLAVKTITVSNGKNNLKSHSYFKPRFIIKNGKLEYQDDVVYIKDKSRFKVNSNNIDDELDKLMNKTVSNE